MHIRQVVKMKNPLEKRENIRRLYLYERDRKKSFYYSLS